MVFLADKQGKKQESMTNLLDDNDDALKSNKYVVPTVVLKGKRTKKMEKTCEFSQQCNLYIKSLIYEKYHFIIKAKNSMQMTYLDIKSYKQVFCHRNETTLDLRSLYIYLSIFFSGKQLVPMKRKKCTTASKFHKVFYLFLKNNLLKTPHL